MTKLVPDVRTGLARRRLVSMDEGLPPGRDQRAVDKQHLDLLSAFHFVGAGFALLGLGFVFLHYLLFSTVFNNPNLWKNAPSPPPTGIFDMLKFVYLVLGGWMAMSLVFNLLAGLYLRGRRHRTFCFIVAAVNCLHMPLGTVLGIFTIVVLARDSVRLSFEAKAHGLDPLR